MGKPSALLTKSRSFKKSRGLNLLSQVASVNPGGLQSCSCRIHHKVKKITLSITYLEVWILKARFLKKEEQHGKGSYYSVHPLTRLCDLRRKEYLHLPPLHPPPPPPPLPPPHPAAIQTVVGGSTSEVAEHTDEDLQVVARTWAPAPRTSPHGQPGHHICQLEQPDHHICQPGRAPVLHNLPLGGSDHQGTRGQLERLMLGNLCLCFESNLVDGRLGWPLVLVGRPRPHIWVVAPWYCFHSL